MQMARQGIVSPQMKLVAEKEGLDAEFVRQGVADGTIVIPANPRHRNLQPCGIGKGLSTKVNANVGTSSDHTSLETELEKVRVVMEYKSDAIMDLSTGGDINASDGPSLTPARCRWARYPSTRQPSRRSRSAGR